MGSHGFPAWFWTALDKIKAGEYGQTDVRETFDDATQLAIRDQERAGIDVICDGEMRRFFFVQTFYGKMDGLEALEPLRKTGLYAYDSVPRYRATRKITVPKGLGTVDEFRYLKTQTDRPVKATCPGPVTLSIHVQTRPGDVYNGDRLALCWDLVPAVNAELKALAAAGAEWIQVDEPSAAIVPGQIGEYVKMFNACVEGVPAQDRLSRVLRQSALAPAGEALLPLDVPASARHEVRPVRVRVRQPGDGGDRHVEGRRRRPRRGVRRRRREVVLHGDGRGRGGARRPLPRAPFPPSACRWCPTAASSPSRAGSPPRSSSASPPAPASRGQKLGVRPDVARRKRGVRL